LTKRSGAQQFTESLCTCTLPRGKNGIMNPYAINPPELDVPFEKLCLALLRRHWSRPGLERFAKKGEEQFGVDIFDTLGESPMYGAQCKLKEQWKSLDPGEITEEVEKAKTFPSKLDHYAILTTGKISGGAQLVVQAINLKHRAAGLFTVELFTWDKISELIRQYPEIEQEFYGGLRAEEVATVRSQLDHLLVKITESASSSATTEIDVLIDEARTNITPSNALIALSLLNRIQRSKGGVLSEWHRFRILTNLGAASLMLGKGTEAAEYFLQAKELRPDDELAITNEVLAYHLLLRDGETQQKAAAAIERFPNSKRLRFLWLQSSPPGSGYEALLNTVPHHMRKDAEVASALARRAMAGGQINRAIEHAKDAVADKPKWSQAHFLLAQTYFARMVMAECASTPLTAEDKQANLTNSFAAADQAISLADEAERDVKAQALALKADIALAEGRKEDAARFARESFGADPTQMQGRLAMAQAAVGLGNLDEGIRILEEAYTHADFAANVSFMLGQALLGRGTEPDIGRAVDVLTSATLEGLPRELADPIIASAARALVRAKRIQKVSNYLQRPEVAASAMLGATIKAYVALKQSREGEAIQFLEEAIASRRADDSRSATDFLARTLLEAGRLIDALPLLQELFNAQLPTFDAGLLLNCAARLKRDDVILETCQVLYERGIRDWGLTEFESQYLEEYDFPKAIVRLEEFIKTNPEHRLAKVRLAIVGARFSQNDRVDISEEILPTPDSLPMRYAVPVVHLLQSSGQTRLAVDYSYRVLRAHYSELEAHKAYLASLLSSSRPEEIPATMERVEIGSAVQYSEGGDVPAGWLVIDNTDKPSTEFEELSGQSEIARELLGKRVGDSFVLAKSPIRDRVGKIVQILSKYTRRFQDVGEQMQLKFGAQSVIHTMRVPPPEKFTLSDLQPMLDSVKAKAETDLKLRAIYKSSLVTLHLYGDRSGHNSFEALLNLAVSEDDFVRCVPGSRDFLVRALSALGSKSTVVVDLTALATLHLLGISRQVLTSTAFRFVMTPATFTELQELRAKSRQSAPHSVLYYEKGQHYIAETTEKESEKRKDTFEEFMQCVQRNVEVVPVPQLATLKPEQRRLLEQVLGRYGLESGVLALSPGYIWWTDDFAAADVVEKQLGSERVWTQALLEHLATLGVLDRSVVDEAYAKLVGFNYQATHFTGAAVVAALRVASGSIGAFPMHQMIRAFEPLPVADPNAAFRLLGEIILRMTLEPILPETRCMATKALLDTFPDDRNTKVQLGMFRSQCAALMTLNPIAQADFIRCFDQWNREKVTRKLIVEP
jgi:tetratricopeptide (TPR) repeat protein